MTLLESIREKAAKAYKHIVLAEGEEERIIRAAEIVNNRKIAKLTLIGDPAVIAENVRTPTLTA